MVYLGKAEAARRQAIGKSMGGKAWIVLEPGKALLLCRGNDMAVDNQCRSAVMIESGYADDTQVKVLKTRYR